MAPRKRGSRTTRRKVVPVLSAVLVSLGVVFLAELGDKSQLITMTYALRHRWWVVLTGVGIAAFLVHGLSVTIGHFVGLTLPQRPIAFAAAVAFIGFAIWTWRGKDEPDDDPGAPVAEHRFVVLAVVSSFVLAELGDKTMLATVTLAADNDVIGVWIGSTVGMVAADALAIAIGRAAGRHLPERLIARGAAVLFAVFGLALIAGEAGALAAVAAGAVTLVGAIILIRAEQGKRAATQSVATQSTATQPVAEAGRSFPAGQPLGQ